MIFGNGATYHQPAETSDLFYALIAYDFINHKWSLVDWFTFEIHSVHEHKHHVMWNTFQEVGDLTIRGVLHPLVDLLHRDQRDRL